MSGVNGVLVIDKPAGMTSHDVVNRVRRLLRERSVGHLGTLDPMATGVLPLLLGRMTRLAQFYGASEKVYEGEIRFGFTTDTYDAQGERVGEAVSAELSVAVVSAATAEFQGVIEQIPPPFSAKKIQGVPAYKLARRHQPVELKPVKVEVREFEITEAKGDRARFRARVSSGTYLRSIAHEMGKRLGCGAHLASLRRTAAGEFDLSMAYRLAEVDTHFSELTEYLLSDVASKFFVPARDILPGFPAVTAPEESLARLLHGNPVNLPEFSRAPWIRVFRGQCELVAIARRVAGTLFHPKVVLAEVGPGVAQSIRQ